MIYSTKKYFRFLRSVFLLLFFLFVILLPGGVEELNVDKQIFFDHLRIENYVQELENRYAANPGNIAIAKQLYRSYFLAEKFTKAEKLLASLLKKINKKEKKLRFALHFDLLKSLMYSYQFDKAITYIDQMRKELKKLDKKIQLQLALIQKRVAASSNLPAKDAEDRDTAFHYEKVFQDLLPVPYAKLRFSPSYDRLYVKRKKSWYLFDFNKSWLNGSLREITLANKKNIFIKDVEGDPQVALGGNRFVSKYGNRYFLYSRQKKKDEKKSKKADYRWIENKIFTEPDRLVCYQPHFSPEMRFMFISCRTNQKDSDFDIYYSRKLQNNEWSTFLKLPFSSEGNDINPIMTPDGRYLLFSSNGHAGYGGYDLFYLPLEYRLPKRAKNPNTEKSKRQKEASSFLSEELSPVPYFAFKNVTHEKGKKLKEAKKIYAGPSAKNLGKRINSFRDESGQIGFLHDGKSLLLYRYNHDNGAGMYSVPLPSFMRYRPIRSFHVTVEDADTSLRPAVRITLIPRDKREKRGKRSFLLGEKNSGAYFALEKYRRYFIKARSKGYFYHFDYLNEKSAGDSLRIPLRKIKVGETLTAKGILFNSNVAILKPEAKDALDAIVELLQDNPNLRIRLEGHTSHIGAGQERIMDQSMRLSEDRALAVREYLIKNEIYPRRLNIKGFGPTRPIPGIKLTSGRNRRTEIRVIGINWDPSFEIIPKIVFADFYSKIGNDDFTFLERSIPNAINTSLSDQGFIFKKIDRDQWKHNLQDIKDGRIKNFSQRGGYDAVVYGYYEADAVTLSIHPKLFISDLNKSFDLEPISTANSPEMFQRLDDIARTLEEKLYESIQMRKQMSKDKK